ncbi:MAG: hypothetical protein U1U88_002072 [Lawsonella clevelandensis]
MRILLVDHHDSYTHILGHLFYRAGQQLGYAVEVDIVPHDCPSWQAGRKDEVSATTWWCSPRVRETLW